MSRKIISLDSYLNIVLKNIMFGDMREHFLSLIYGQILARNTWGPINPDGGSIMHTGIANMQMWQRIKEERGVRVTSVHACIGKHIFL